MSGGTLQNLLLLTSPLGDDTQPVEQGTLHATALEAHETVGQPFEITLDVVSTAHAVSPDSLLNQSVSVTVRRKDGIDRVFNGIVRRMDTIGTEQRNRWHYRLEVVPRLWFMSHTVDCRIFQQKTAVEILRQVFGEHGVAPVEFRVTGAQPTREYTTQFNEDDLAFCQRIMQESGLFYTFEHAIGTHRMIVTDSNRTFKAMAQPVHRVLWLGENVDIFDRWQTGASIAPGQVRHQDYDPERPSSPVNGQQSVRDPGPGAGQRKVYRWPAMTTSNAVALDRARYEGEAATAAASVCRGHGYDPNLCPGFTFTIADNPISGSDGNEYGVVETRHSAHDESWIGGATASSFDCSFAAVPQKVTWRDRLTVARPSMPGIFPAIVLGEGGEEIHADRLARIKVRPLFDHRKETVASMAIWVRVMHAWAGDRWGWQHLPRVGTEVGISFMSGDPDNPVVVGSFYNEEMPPVFPVPAEQTKQGFRSRSTLRGGIGEYNELSFDDRIGQEMLLVHAQKDHKVEVEHDQTDTIGNDRTVRTNRNDSLTSTVGDITVTAEAGSVTIEAATMITLRCGASTITITPASISMTSTAVTVTAEADISVQATGALTANAVGAIEVSGLAAVDINALGVMTLNAVGEMNLAAAGAMTLESPEGIICIPFPV